MEEPRPAGTGEPSARGAADRFVLDPDGRRKAYRPLPLSTRRGALEAFLETYMARRYFDAHEILEPAWMGTDDPAERALHQGLIKVAAAGVHASRGNARGAVQNLEGALRRLLIAADAATAVSPSEGDAEAPFAEVDGAGARNAPRAAGLVSMLGLVDLKAVVRWAEAAIELLRRPGADPEALARVTAFLAAAPAPARLETPDVAQRADQGPSPIPVQSTVRRQADAEPA